MFLKIRTEPESLVNEVVFKIFLLRKIIKEVWNKLGAFNEDILNFWWDFVEGEIKETSVRFI